MRTKDVIGGSDRCSVKGLLLIRRDEVWLAVGIAVVLLAFHGLVCYCYGDVFMADEPNHWKHFLHRFRLSGYDPMTHRVLTEWLAGYNVYRHPLLAFFVAPLYWVNMLLWSLTGVNCALFVIGAVWTVFGVYGFLFLYRIEREIVGIGRSAAIVLAWMLYGFGHVLVASVSGDHFIVSMSLLLGMLYLCGMKMKHGRTFGLWESVGMFVAIAGVTLSSGVKVFLGELFVNKAGFFRPRYLLLAVAVPAALMWGTARLEYHYLVLPRERAEHAARAKEAALRKQAAEQRQAKAQQDGERRMLTVKQRKRQNPNGRPISNGEFLRWTDMTTSRGEALVENIFGEGIQLHEDYLLEDVLRSRPVVVRYRHAWNYAAEGLLALLFLLGLARGLIALSGWRRQFLLLLLALVSFDMLLHLGLGFGLNEVYIMSAHWIFVIPVAMGCLLEGDGGIPGRWRKAWRKCAFALLCGLTAYLWLYNGGLFAGYLVGKG